jgi:hypothetical protein
MADRGEWTGDGGDGMTWRLEIEPDCFDFDDPVVVSVWTENEDGSGKSDGLAMLTPEMAREAAAVLLAAADSVEEANRMNEATPAAEDER